MPLSAWSYRSSVFCSACEYLGDGCRVEIGFAESAQAEFRPLPIVTVTTSRTTETPVSTRVLRFVTAIADLRRIRDRTVRSRAGDNAENGIWLLTLPL